MLRVVREYDGRTAREDKQRCYGCCDGGIKGCVRGGVTRRKVREVGVDM